MTTRLALSYIPQQRICFSFVCSCFINKDSGKENSKSVSIVEATVYNHWYVKHIYSSNIHSNLDCHYFSFFDQIAGTKLKNAGSADCCWHLPILAGSTVCDHVFSLKLCFFAYFRLVFVIESGMFQ